MDERAAIVEGAPPVPDLELQLADAERRAHWATMRVGELQAEIQRLHEARRIAIGAVVAVALLAILMLGLVAFKVADDAGDGEAGVARVQLTERSVPAQ